MSKTIPFTKQAVKAHLDMCIKFWRGRKLDPNDEFAECYVDAYQSMRTSLFGELLP